MNSFEKRLRTRIPRGGWVVGSIGVLAAIALVAPSLALSGTASASSHPHARPHVLHGTNSGTSFPPVAFEQEFSSNTNYFCPAGSGNPNCDGAEGDYGTIDRVASGFSNGGEGNYAPSTPALDTLSASKGGGYMALIDGSQVINQGQGCPSTVGEYCTGPYALFGTGAGRGAWNVFPAAGFTVTDDVYLSPTTAGPAGSLVDDDVELNDSAGGYGIDNVITACAETDPNTSDMAFYISTGHGSPGSCSTGGTAITNDGWYRFVFVFSDVTGDAYLSEFVYQEGSPLTEVWQSNPQNVSGSPSSVSTWGGPGYLWFPTEQFDGLPIANFAVQTGTHNKGYSIG
jgi:hypothetical protein